MPRYYFDVRYDSEPWRDDPDGMVLGGRTAARATALERLVKATEELLHDHWQIQVRVRDRQAEPLLTFTLSLSAAERGQQGVQHPDT